MIPISCELIEAWNKLNLLYEEETPEQKKNRLYYRNVRNYIADHSNSMHREFEDFDTFTSSKYRYPNSIDVSLFPAADKDDNGELVYALDWYWKLKNKDDSGWERNEFLNNVFVWKKQAKDPQGKVLRVYKNYYSFLDNFLRDIPILNSTSFKNGFSNNTSFSQAEAAERTERYEKALNMALDNYNECWDVLPEGFKKYIKSTAGRETNLGQLIERNEKQLEVWKSYLDSWKNYVSHGALQAQKLRQWKAEHNNQDLIYYFVTNYYSLSRVLKSNYIKATLEDSRSASNLGRETLDEPTLKQLNDILDKNKILPDDPRVEPLMDRLRKQDIRNGQLRKFYKNYISLTTDESAVPNRRGSRYSCGIILSLEKLAQRFETDALLKTVDAGLEYNFSRDNKTTIEITDIGLASREIPVVTDSKEVITKVLPKQYFLTVSTLGSIPITKKIYNEIKERWIDSGSIPQTTKPSALSKKCVPGTFYSTRLIVNDDFVTDPSATGAYLDDKADELLKQLSNDTGALPKKRKLVIADLSKESQDWLFNNSLLNEFELRLALDPNGLIKQQVDDNGKKVPLTFNLDGLIIGIICDSTIYSFLNPADDDFNIDLRQFKTYNDFKEKILVPRKAERTRFNNKTSYITKTDQITVTGEQTFSAFCDVKDYIKERIQSDPAFIVKYIPAEHESKATRNTNLIESWPSITHGFNLIFNELI